MTDNEKIEMVVELISTVVNNTHKQRTSLKERRLVVKLLKELLGRTPIPDEVDQCLQ